MWMPHVDVAILSLDHLLDHLVSRRAAFFKSFSHEVVDAFLQFFVANQVALSDVNHHFVQSVEYIVDTVYRWLLEAVNWNFQ